MQHRRIWNQDTWEVGSRLFSHRKKILSIEGHVVSAVELRMPFWQLHLFFFLFVFGGFLLSSLRRIGGRKHKVTPSLREHGKTNSENKKRATGNSETRLLFPGFMNMYFTCDTRKPWIIVGKKKQKQILAPPTETSPTFSWDSRFRALIFACSQVRVYVEIYLHRWRCFPLKKIPLVRICWVILSDGSRHRLGHRWSSEVAAAIDLHGHRHQTRLKWLTAARGGT